MAAETVQIVRYPNRRFYDRGASRYVSLEDIERLVRTGVNVEISDSQTQEDLTRSVLTRIIMERQPEKMQLFPTDMLHFILRSNDVMSDFLRDYFRHSLTYLNYLQRHGGAVGSMAQPIHWVKAWLDRIAPASSAGGESGESTEGGDEAEGDVADRIAELERRLRTLEQQGRDDEPSAPVDSSNEG